MRPDEPITSDWLRARGWRGCSRSRLPGYVIRDVGHELRCGRQPFHSPDDLCIALAPGVGDDGGWNCWVYQMEPYRHIHIRPVAFTWEVVRLWEGLTGCGWDDSAMLVPRYDPEEGSRADAVS